MGSPLTLGETRQDLLGLLMEAILKLQAASESSQEDRGNKKRKNQERRRVKSVKIEGLKLNENTLVALLLLSPEVCANVCVTQPVMTDAVPRCFPARRP